MSFYFADDDSLTFGVQSSNVREVAQFSSTTEEAFVHLYTNNNLNVDNTAKGVAFGTSNYDKTASAKNDFYIGHIDNGSLTRVMTVREDRVGIRTSNPQAKLHITPGTGDSMRVDGLSFINPSMVINSNGYIGIGTTPSFPQIMTVNGRMVVDNLSVACASDTSPLITAFGMKNPPTVSFLNFGFSHLSNISRIDTPFVFASNTVQTDTLITSRIASLTSNVNCMNTSFSNTNSLFVNNTVFTNKINPIFGNTLETSSNLRVGGDLTVVGNISIRGEFTIVETTTCNTNQFQVDNDGTGTALIVNQWGNENIAQFSDDKNVVMIIRNGGQTAFGSFCNANNNILNAFPASLVYMENQPSSNTTALVIRQMNNSQDALRIHASTASNLVVNGNGNIGIGTLTPMLPLDIWDTRAILIPSGTVGQRPSNPTRGSIRYNTTSQQFEGFGSNNTWGSIGGVRDVANTSFITAELFPGANDQIMRFHTSNIEQLRINARGNVGIGTVNPMQKLEVAGNAHINGQVVVMNDPTNNWQTGGIRFRSSNNSIDAAIVQNSNGVLVFRPPTNDNGNGFNFTNASGDTSVVRILQNGNVGFGSTTPNARIDVVGDMNITATGSTTGTLRLAPAVSNTEASIGFYQQSNMSGNIWTLGTGSYSVGSSNFALGVSARGEAVMSWLASGNVGVGMTNPKYKFQVNNSMFLGDITYETTGISTANNVKLVFDNTSNASAGQGIPANKIVLQSNVATSWLAGVGVENNAVAYHSGGHHNFYTNTTPSAYGSFAMRIKNDGNLGIGVTDPQNRLDVMGGMRIMQNAQSIRLAPQNKDAESSIGFYMNSNLTGYSWTVGQGVNNVGQSNFAIGSSGLNNVISIQTSGNVGIRKDAPIATLDVNGTLNVQSTATFSNNVYLDTKNLYLKQTQDYGIKPSTGTINQLQGLFLYGSNGGALGVNGDAFTLMWNNSGVCIGHTNPSFHKNTLDVNGKVAIGAYAGLCNSTPNGVIVSGFVGIGQPNPACALDVTGTAQVTQNIITPSFQVTNITTAIASCNINLSAKNVSNVTTLSTVNITSDNPTINFMARTLSNVQAISLNVITSDVKTINASFKNLSNIDIVSTAQITSDNQNINVSNKSLSNVNTLSVANITSDATSINMNSKILSNVQTVSTVNIRSDTSTLNFTNNTLSNVNTISLNNVTSDGTNINVSNKTLSNINTAFVTNLTSPVATINVSNKILSNVQTVSTANITADTQNINVSNKTLSNINTLSVANIISDLPYINFSGEILSNVATISLANITSDLPTINVTARNMSNIQHLYAASLNTNVVNTHTATNKVINFSDTTLSNVNTLSVVRITSDTQNINMAACTVSNVNVLSTNVITSDATNINMSNKTLSNIGTVNTRFLTSANQTTNVVDGSTVNLQLASLATNSIRSLTGTDINFNSCNLIGINNLTLAGDLRVRGEFIVTNTTTYNTNQLSIDNDNFGPALLINQQGTHDIARFTDDSNIVMSIRDGGQSIFGSFGCNINTIGPLPTSRVFMQNPANENMSVLQLQQYNSSQNVFTAIASNQTTFVVDKSGNVGVGTTNPRFNMHMSGSMFIGDMGYASTTIPTNTTVGSTANSNRLIFDNTINGTAGSGLAANKIVLHNNDGVIGFGVEGEGLAYHTNNGNKHNFYVNSTVASSYGSKIVGIDQYGITVQNGNNNISVANPQLIFEWGGSSSGTKGGYRHSIRSRHDSVDTNSNAIDFFVWQSSDTRATLGSKHVMSVTSGGVGIGTTTPVNMLDVRGACAIGTYAGLCNTSANNLIVSGRVGIGTFNPGTNLDIQSSEGNPRIRLLDKRGEGNATVSFREYSDDYGYDMAYEGVNNSDNKLHFKAFSGNQVARYDVTIDRSSGNVGIGTTTPQNKLDVFGGCAIGTYAGVRNMGANNNNNLVVSGSVGIGTMNPQYKVDITGQLNLSTVGLTVNSGMVAWYTGDSWNSTLSQWTDLSGNNNHGTQSSTRNINVGTINGSPYKYIFGGIDAGINFPMTVTYNSYTLFHVARYTNTTDATARKRIFTTSDVGSPNWLSGFSDNAAGVSFQGNNYITHTPVVDYHGTNWVFSSDQRGLYRSQGVQRSVSASTLTENFVFGVNIYSIRVSDWAVAEVILFNRVLSLPEIQAVETYLFNKYKSVSLPDSTLMIGSSTSPPEQGTSLSTLGSVFVNGNIGIGTTLPQFRFHSTGSAFIGDMAYASNVIPATVSTLNTPNMQRLVFDNTFNGTPGAGNAANKIVMHNNNAVYGFGVELDSMTYHVSSNHNFYCGALGSSYGSLCASVNSEGILVTKRCYTNDGTSTSGSRPSKGFYVWTDYAFGMELQMQNGTSNTTFVTRAANGGFSFRNTVGSNMVYINSSGYVGINTTNPLYSLEVNGIIGCSNYIKFPNFDGGKRVVLWEDATGGYNGLGKDGNATTYSICATTDHHKFIAYTRNTSIQNELMRITGTGSVGIGTQAPQDKLHVYGNIIAGSNISYLSYLTQGFRTSNVITGVSSSNYVIQSPTGDGEVNGVNITALNKRTRASYATVEQCIKSWTSRQSPNEANGWFSICWSPELSLFVAVAYTGSNRIMTSPDCITWTGLTAPNDSTNPLKAVCWSSELRMFVAVADGGSNRISISSTGLSWTQRSILNESTNNPKWQSVCWSPELRMFVAVANSGIGRIMTSADGLNWTSTSTADSGQWTSVCWSPELSLFVAVAEGGTGRVMSSSNGINWGTRSAPNDSTNTWRSVCWSPELSLFVAVGNGGSGRIMISADAITWAPKISPNDADNAWQSVCWSPELSVFVAVGSSGTGGRIMSSQDGITWTSRSSTFDTNNWVSICWSSELSLFVAVAFGGSVGGTSKVMTSSLGLPNSQNTLLAPTTQFMIQQSTGNIGIGSTSPAYKLDIIGDCRTSQSFISPTLQVSNITTTEPTTNINVNAKSFSNVANVATNTIQVTSTITTPTIQSPTSTVSFNNNRVIDVDSLIVRSNVTVQLVGTNTFTNLPTDLVRLDAVTGRILDQYISTAVVRLMAGSTYVNANILPPVETNRNTLMHTRDRVGVGLRNPQQKLHVHGNQCITSGRLGIGTWSPNSVLHVIDNNGPSPTVYIEQQGSMNIMQVVGSNSKPILYINANNSIGIQKTNPSASFALDVEGAIACSNIQTRALRSPTGTIDCTSVTLDQVIDIKTTPAGSVATNTLKSHQSSSTITVTSAMNVTGFNTSLYTSHQNMYGSTNDVTKIGIKVDNNVLAQAYLSTSDYRIKRGIIESDASSNLDKVLRIPVKEFTVVPSSSRIAGFIAQEVEQVIPYAVKSTTNAIPNIMMYPTQVSADGCTLTILDHPLTTFGQYIKVIDGTVEKVCKVVGVVPSVSITVDTTIANSPEGVLVYGEIVDDFKLIDTDKLVPLLFDAVKAQHGQILSLTSRLERLENHIFPV